MNRLAGWLLLLATPATAAPFLELDVRLDPDSRHFEASAELRDDVPLPALALAEGFSVERLEVDGRAQPLPAGPWRYRPEAAARRLRLSYRGTLAPLAAADHRRVLGALPAMADPQGSYLPAGAGWYPDPGALAGYRLRLALPAGQKGLVPGELVREDDGPTGYRAEYHFPWPTEGIELMAGPYRVSERLHPMPGDAQPGAKLRLRAWFHAELGDLAEAYLADSARYIDRYQALLGAYPYSGFSIVSSPLPTGYGLPGATYLGREVLRLPFIRTTSLGHEILHNWWGNGVYPDWRRGNWSEGLTTFLADYAYREEQSPAAARETRLGWLRDLAAVPDAALPPLASFVARQHGISAVVGYGQSAMLFLMLRDRIGEAAFQAGLRRFWQDWRFRTAAWDDLAAAFAAESGQDLSAFFRQWLHRPGAPAPVLTAAHWRDGRLRLALAGLEGYALRLPIRLVYGDRQEDRWLDAAPGSGALELPLTAPPEAVLLDPDYRLWRRPEPASLPAILREVFIAPRVERLLLDADPATRQAAGALADALLDGEAATAPGLPRLVLGAPEAVATWLAREGLPPPPELLGGDARVWAGRAADGRPYAVVAAPDAATYAGLSRGLPHYGKQSWLVFKAGRVLAKGTWPPAEVRVPVLKD